MITKTINKSDIIGALASSLCVIHCLATPFLFVIQSCHVERLCCASGPIWWRSIDYLFIGIAFFAVYHSSKNTSKSWMKYSLFASWMILSILILNESFGFMMIAEWCKYFVAFIMVTLHLINLKYYQCQRCV